jgi:hypothetical protein
MDRREYLGVTGSSIIALLGGCSSSEGGGQSTDTATGTATRTPTGTATRTTTQQEENTTTSETTENSEEQYSEREVNLAEQIGVTKDLAQWAFSVLSGDGSSSIDPSPVRNADVGAKAEAAASQIDAESMDGEIYDGPWNRVNPELAYNIAEEMNTFWHNDITGYDTVFSFPRHIQYQGPDSHAIFTVIDDKLTVTNPVEKILNDGRSLNAREWAEIMDADRDTLKDDYTKHERRTSNIFRYNRTSSGDIAGHIAYEFADPVIDRIEGAPRQIIATNNIIAENTNLFDPREENSRDHPGLAVDKGAIRTLDHKLTPDTSGDFATIRDPFAYQRMVDQVHQELLTEYDVDIYEEGLPDDLAIVVSSEGPHDVHEEFDSRVEDVHRAPYNEI